MKRKSILALTVAAALGAAIAVPAFADGYHGHRGDHAGGPHSGMDMMRGQGGMGMMHGRGGMGMMHGRGGMGDMDMMQARTDTMGAGHRRMGMMAGRFFQAFDADDDGTVSPEEARAGLLDQLKSHDSDGNGTLSIEEFEPLHAAAIRTHMVDRFQALDEDGDGEVTEDEITAPAKRIERMQQMRQMMMQGAADDNGSMMDEN